MSFLTKKFNYNDPNNFISEDKFVGTFAFYKRKYGDKLDDHTLEIFEVLAKADVSEQAVLIEEIKERKKAREQQLINEFKDRHADGLENSLSTCNIKNK